MAEAGNGPAARGWQRLGRARRALAHSLRLRLVLVFLLLALAMTAIFLVGMQKALGVGWREAARPLVADYVDRLVADIGSPPSIERAQALADRLPLAVHISGPQINWSSAGEAADAGRAAPWRRNGRDRGADAARDDGGWSESTPRLAERRLADGHRIAFTLHVTAWQDPPRRIGWITLAVLLGLTGLAYAWVRRLLAPLDDIRTGADRFGGGDFATPIAVRRPDELGALAGRINTMAHDLQAMLDAKRALLLAISHELRSPLTRARLHAELLPEDGAAQAPREALLRELALMRDLVNDLLESERLSTRHAALHREPVDLAALAREVVDGFGPREDGGPRIRIDGAAGLGTARLDAARVRLLVRNLLDNALRHTPAGAAPPELWLGRDAAGAVLLRVRDHGPGVGEADLSRLAEPFYRPDSARTRAAGGVGLGLYLCRLVAQAHGGELRFERAEPGLAVHARLPAA